MTSIIIAEDHQSIIDGIALLLEPEKNYQIIAMANDGKKLLELVKNKKPDIVITDIRMPKLDGVSATKLIKQELPHTKIIAFTMLNEPEAIQQMLNAGADGYLLKNSHLKNLKQAIDTVIKNKTYLDIEVRKVLAKDKKKHKTKSNLSKSEQEILKLIGEGKTSNEIAELRFCSVSTIETHRKNMMRKLSLKGKGELLRYALERKYNT